MCVMSVIYDSTTPWWNPQGPNSVPWPTFQPLTPYIEPWKPPVAPGPTKEQFQELIELLKAAKKFDTLTGQKDCEDKVKKEVLRKVAESLGLRLPDDL